MNTRILLAALAGGVAMFLWGFVAHMVLPLGEVGINALPYQEKVLPAISAEIKDQGLYIFPWPESAPGQPMPANAEAQKKVQELYKTLPHGLLLFHPPGGAALSGGQLLTEFVTNVISSWIAALLVWHTLGSLSGFAKRVLFVTALGLSAAIAVNVPYWNWYGFPGTFTVAEMVEHVVGFGVVGVVIGLIIKPSPAKL